MIMQESIKSFEEVTKFHGHICPGSALGYRAAEAGMKELSQKRAPDEELVAIVENDSCAVDAIQVVSGCTMGKGNLIFQDYGKQAYTFLNRATGDAIRVSLKSSFDPTTVDSRLGELRQKLAGKKASEEEKKELDVLMSQVAQRILDMPLKDMFIVKKVDTKEPNRARIFKSLKCSSCGEMVSENRARIKKGNIVCIPCFEK
jgi:formylmethanofuran dehydrogenase subunit E